MPGCVGGYTARVKNSDCSNATDHSGRIEITGLDLTRAGTVQGGITIYDDQGTENNPDGTCFAQPRSPPKVLSASYVGTWDGAAGSLAATGSADVGSTITLTGTFTASVVLPTPVFPLTVTSNITATTANASAQFQPRPQDVGKSESVFVFAHAPASRVQGAKRAQPPTTGPIRLQDGGDPCVLAQVNSAGQLVAASASSMTPALNNVVLAQSQSVTLLNNVPTPGVAGATIFTGYGSDSQSMLASGVYQGAVTVPGAVSCATTLVTAAAPASPGALSGLWYDGAESGWGIYFAQRRNILFAAWYTYDASGKPRWYVSSSCAMPDGVTGTSGTCNGTLFEVAGPVFFGVAFDPSREHVTNAGTLQVAFTDANHASMTYTVAGQTRTVPITRQVFQTSAVPPAVDFTDLWYNAAESGWGMAMSHQFGIIFLAWFVYDANGAPVWYVASSCTVSGNGCSGALYRTTGPAFGPTFNPAAVQPFQVGTVSVTFNDANHALLSYTVDGVSATKVVTRQTF
jgi:hypothetical protein